MDEIKEIEKEVKPIMVRAYCPDCGVELKQSPTVLATYPPMYGYECPNCGGCITSYKDYPYIRYI